MQTQAESKRLPLSPRYEKTEFIDNEPGTRANRGKRRSPAIGVLRLVFIAASAAAVVAAANFAHAQTTGIHPLPALRADLSRTSVSGLSSGAFMAAQFDVAYSGEVIGAGIVAGGEFYCAGAAGVQPLSMAASTSCMRPIGSAPKAEIALKHAREFAARGLIDNPNHLKKQRIYLFSGAKDTVVYTKVVDQADRFYELAGVPTADIQYEKHPNAGHALITNRAGDIACESNQSPFINNCGIEQSQRILHWIYAKPKAALNKPAHKPAGTLAKFDQRAFDPDHSASLDDVGYVYIPHSCTREHCAVHVAFHGCLQNARSVGERFVHDAGYNELADTNRIIVLYPQVDADTVHGNPLGCWDFWGYTHGDSSHPLAPFYSKQAPQMAAIMKMIRRLGESAH